MPLRYSSTINIPSHWTGEQASAVLCLLDEIYTAIWNIHDDKILEAMLDEQALLDHVENEEDFSPCPIDDDIPF